MQMGINPLFFHLRFTLPHEHIVLRQNMLMITKNASHISTTNPVGMYQVLRVFRKRLII